MGILVQQSSVSTALAALRNSGLPGAIAIQYAAVPTNHPGMVYVDSGRDLVAHLRRNGWPEGYEMRVQWAMSPAAPATVANEVRLALMQGVGVKKSLGAQAYATGNTPVFGAAPSASTMAHEATHVIQQRQGGGND
jgi:hypothetical protein